MNTVKLNISEYHAKCPNCNIETDFIMFESGCRGDLEIYIGDTTKTVYRIDMNKIHYLNLEIDELLRPAIVAEGGANKLRNIPNQVACKACKSIFYAAPVAISGESRVNAIDL